MRITKKGKHTLLLLLSIFSFISCSKDSEDPNPFYTTITASDFTTTMDENPENGKIIGIVAATTNQGSIAFSIREQSPENAFTIDPNSGELKVLNKQLFNFETNPIITGVIGLTNGLVFKESNVSIFLNDLDEDNIYNGGIALFTQEEVNTFGANNYTHIIGGLTIGSIDNTYSNITDLSPLNSLTSVGAQMNIAHNSLLQNFNGLENIEEIGNYLLIWNNPLLNNINAFTKITEIGGYLYIDNNDKLVNLHGLENITLIGGDLGITSNEILTDINSLQNVKSIGKRLIFDNNPNLLNFNLSSLTEISEKLDIRFCPKITNLNSLTNLQTVGTDIYLWSNSELSDFCGLQNLLIGNGLGGNYTANGNAYNPTEQDIIDGNCSL
jgi:hypothetical protein